MPEVPERLRTPGRHPVPHFELDELLFRRSPPKFISQGRIEIDSIPLPDMSVNRSKFSEPGDLLICDDFIGWAVIGFTVGSIPPSILDQGVFEYTFRPIHKPVRNNYSHSEVQVFLDGKHIGEKSRIPPEVHLRFRRRLAADARIMISPGGGEVKTG